VKILIGLDLKPLDRVKLSPGIGVEARVEAPLNT
jgi:hypothetical protein